MRLRNIAYLIIGCFIVLHFAEIPFVYEHTHPRLELIWWAEAIFILLSPVFLYSLTRFERELEAERKLFEEAINSLPGVFYLFDKTGNMLRWNRSFERVSGYSYDEIDVRHPLSYFDEDHQERVARGIQETLATGSTEVEALFTLKSGVQIPYLFYGRRFETDDETYIVGLGVDIQARKAMEEQLRKTETLELELGKARQANALKNRFITLVSHEFRTPLSVIQLAAQMLQRYWERLDVEKRAQQLERILTQTQQIDQLLSDFSVAVEVETHEDHLTLETVDAAALCEQIARQITEDHERSRPIQVIQKLDDPMVNQSRRLLVHVVRNLLDNAVKYSDPESDIQCEVTTEDENVIISITDQGIGIAENDLPLVFQPYFRTQDTGNVRGTGLGLKVVRDCVQAMGGEIEVESQFGVGSVFRVRVPRTLPTAFSLESASSDT